MKERASAPKAVQDCHLLMLWMIPKIDQFPRARKFTLGERIENSLLDVLRYLVQAQYEGRGRKKSLQQANTELTLIRHLWRLAFKLGVISSHPYEVGSKKMVELGMQLGAWEKAY